MLPGPTDSTGFPLTTKRIVTWQEAVTDGTQIRVYYLTKCLNPPTPEGVPCIVKHMALPPGSLKLIAKAPAAQETVSWTWPTPEDIGGAFDWDGQNYYYGLVIAAYNAVGHSRFIIIGSGESCTDCTY